MKIKFDDIDPTHGPDSGNYLGHAVLNCITDEVFKANFNANDFDLTLTINGIEVPVDKFFKELKKQHEQMLNETAGELVSKELDRIRSIGDTVKSFADELVAKHLGEGYFVCDCGEVNSKNNSGRYCKGCSREF